MFHGDIDICLFDLDGRRMARLETELRHGLRRHGLAARITRVGCGLEIARQGLTDATPALALNGFVAIRGREITPEDVERFCGRLLIWQKSGTKDE